MGGPTEGAGVEEKRAGHQPQRAEMETWVQCDTCEKWRRVPVEMAKAFTENDQWHCKYNPDLKFNHCKIPQEMSDAEINRQLGIESEEEGGEPTEEEDEEDDASSSSSEEPPTPPQSPGGNRKPAVWQLTSQNIYVSRKKKIWKDEEVMVCQCWPPPPGKKGCLDDCLNRVVKVECLAKHCPCGDACSNQQFQRRAYRKLGLTRCGNKGFGLRALEDIPKQTFFIEYTGEVLDEPTFEARLKEYARAGQRHMYFMTIGTGEFIDACQKGNLGRFINHSCNPNAEIQKWQVRGELCVGLFTLRDVAAGEELTFDYNYDKSRRDAKPCLCGEPQCRGWIGGVLDSPAAKKVHARMERARERGVGAWVEEGEEPEPIMLPEEVQGEEAEVDGGDSPADIAAVLEGNKRFQKKQKQLMENVNKYRSKGQQDLEDAEKKLAKKRKKGGDNDVGPPKQKKVKVGASRLGKGGRGQGGKSGRGTRSEVEKELQALLDEEGGIERGRGAAKEFITLLAQAEVAGGEGRGGRKLCSTRDLMLLLEALVKTESRSVLKDFVATNGLEVIKSLLLHLREDPDKSPVLRKLVRCLEYLTDQGLLRSEHLQQHPSPALHIASASPSLAETLALLERHPDRELQNRVRQYRAKMLPPAWAPNAPTLPAAQRPVAAPPLFPGTSYSRNSEPELARLGVPKRHNQGLLHLEASGYGGALSERGEHNGPGGLAQKEGPLERGSVGEKSMSNGGLGRDRETGRGEPKQGSPSPPFRHLSHLGSSQRQHSESPEWGLYPAGRSRDSSRNEGRARHADASWRGERQRPEQLPDRRGQGERGEMHQRRSPSRDSRSPGARPRERSPPRERRRTGFSDHAGDPWKESKQEVARGQEPEVGSRPHRSLAPGADSAPNRERGGITVAAVASHVDSGASKGPGPREELAAPPSPQSLEAEGRRKVQEWQARMEATIREGEARTQLLPPSVKEESESKAAIREAGGSAPPSSAQARTPAVLNKGRPEGPHSRPGPSLAGGNGMPPNGFHPPPPSFPNAPWNIPPPRAHSGPFPSVQAAPPPPLPPPEGGAPPPPPFEPAGPPLPPNSFPTAPQYKGGPPAPPPPGPFLPPPPMPAQPPPPHDSAFAPPSSLPPYYPPPHEPPFHPIPPPLPPFAMSTAPPPPAFLPPAPAPVGPPSGVPVSASSPAMPPASSGGVVRRGDPSAEDASARDWISDEPTSSDFQHLVMEIVRYRMAAYKFRIQKNKAEEICSKLTGKIISGEKKAYQEREKQGQGKGPRPLQKSVLGNKVKRFVVDYMEQYLSKAGSAVP